MQATSGGPAHYSHDPFLLNHKSGLDDEVWTRPCAASAWRTSRARCNPKVVVASRDRLAHHWRACHRWRLVGPRPGDNPTASASRDRRLGDVSESARPIAAANEEGP